MLSMEHVYHIRYEHKVNGKSLRSIAKEMGHDVKTVSKYAKKEDFSPEKPRHLKRHSKSDQYKKQVKEWLEADETAPRKQRNTARNVYKRLVKELAKEGKMIEVSERTIRTLVAKVRLEIGASKEVALPLFHPAGEAQIDFGETEFLEKGIRYSGHHLCITFPHSDAKFVQLFKAENLECLEQGLTDIFTAIGGAPTAAWLDNMSTAVKAIKAYGLREVTDGFRRFQCHYGFFSNFCNPASGHEKGSVENYVGCSRRNYFVPVPEFDDLVEYNKELLHLCIQDLDRKHYKVNAKVKDLFGEDKEVFLPLPAEPFDCCKYVWGKTNVQGMVPFENNRYSTAGNLPNSKVLLKISAHKITVYDENHSEITSHPRLYGKGQESMKWAPYLRVLAKRPTALRYTGFFEGLNPDLRDFFGEQDLPGKKAILSELAKISETKGLHKSLFGLDRAIKMGSKDVDTLISAFHFAMNMPGEIPKNKIPANLPRTLEYSVSLSEYGKFMEVENHV